MLTKVKAYTSVGGAPTLLLDDAGSEFSDFLHIRGITGLEPVKATINTAAFASIAGAAFVGSNIPTRNIVITLHPNPDWNTWTVETLRKLLYRYFQPGTVVQLVFEDSVKEPVTIFGYTESCEPNPFAKDVEIPVSIICPDPYFSSLNPIVVPGRTTNAYSPETITYNGDVPAGVIVEVQAHAGEPANTSIQIQTVDPAVAPFKVDNVPVDDNQYFIMSSVPGNKYVDIVRNATGVVLGHLSDIEGAWNWPMFAPGDNPFSVVTDAGLHDFTLTYYERFGGL